MKRKALILLLLAANLLPACISSEKPIPAATVVGKQISVQGGAYTDISAAELKTMLANKDFKLINVHYPFEGNIATTDSSNPYDKIDQDLSLLPSDKSAKIVLYCRSGRMSSIAAKTLVSLGYSNVWNLDGGMVAWEQAGLPLEK